MKILLQGLAPLLSLIALFACENFEPAGPPDDSLLDGPVDGLSETENVRFVNGDVAFNDEIFIPENGLGPLFVSSSCGTCHPGDGKGHPFTTLTRFGQFDDTGNQYNHMGGPQLQNRAIPGYRPEQLPPGVGFSKLTPPANTGLGFLDAVSDEEILLWADPDDADGDGVSGTPNWIELQDYLFTRPGAVEHNGRFIGRFGKKAAAYDLLQQTAQAYNQDIGITSTFEPFDTYTGLQSDPEIADNVIQDVVFYLKTLKAPIARNTHNAEVMEGKSIFVDIGCATCHRPEMTTGPSSIAALSYKTFFPYTDLLLHDMGPDLDDGYTEGTAKTSEWRTPALWGLGLSKFSQGGGYFLLHDGRARSIEEAILMHGGEAQTSRENFQSLTDSDKMKLMKFLENL